MRLESYNFLPLNLEKCDNMDLVKRVLYLVDDSTQWRLRRKEESLCCSSRRKLKARNPFVILQEENWKQILVFDALFDLDLEGEEDDDWYF